jgi:hypothetical protein
VEGKGLRSNLVCGRLTRPLSWRILISEGADKIWYGRLDVNCPIGMAEKAASLLKGVKMVFLDEEAHSLVALQTKAIMKSLLVLPS